MSDPHTPENATPRPAGKKSRTASAGAPVEGRGGPVVRRLVSLLGDDVVLLWVAKGAKGPRWSGWQKTGIGMMGDPRYLANLGKDRNIAVLTGAPSGGLCSIDIDDDGSAEEFLALNPALAGTLRSRGNRGCNIWVRVAGGYPPPAGIRRTGGGAWGEWRSTGVCTMIHGTHPAGMEYVRSPEAPPVVMPFSGIVWPVGLELPWLAGGGEGTGGGEPDDAIIERYGAPVFYAKARDGELFVKGINEAYWAALCAAEHTLLHEPCEREFYGYDPGTGLYSPVSPDAIKQMASSRMLGMSRQDESLSPLENLRTDRNLGAVVSQMRGIAEQRDAFAGGGGAVHLADCMLRFEGGTCYREDFSPEFRSRNRSPLAFDPEARCPRFLEELLLPAIDADDAVLLQKMAGQCLTGRNPLQRFVLLDGMPGRGKSQYCNAVQALVGRQNVTQLRTRHLGERFEFYRFLRRTLLVGVDVEADFLSTEGASFIKGLVGGDWFDAEQKGGTGSFQMQGNFNILMTSNCRLKVRLQGDVGAWRRRMLVVRYETPPPKRKIADFADVLVREEGAGILNWALHGLHMLMEDIRETGDIRLTARQAGVVDSLLEESDSLRCFLRENVGPCEDGDLAVGEIVQAYARECPERNWDPLPEHRITRELPSLMLELFQAVRSNNCRRDGKAVRGFRGVGFAGGREDRP